MDGLGSVLAAEHPFVVAPAVHPEVVTILTGITQQLGLLQEARCEDKVRFETMLRAHVPRLVQSASAVPALPVQQPLLPASSDVPAAAGTPDPAPAEGAFMGTGLEDSASDHGGVSDVESEAVSEMRSVVEPDMEVRLPASTMEREAFNTAMTRISPLSCQLVAPDEKMEVHSYLPSPSRTLEMVEWTTPRFAQEAINRLSAKLQGSLTLDPAPYRNRSLRPPQIEFFKPSSVMVKESFRLKLSGQLALQQKPATQENYFPAVEAPQTFVVSAQWFRETQALCQRVSIACGQALAGTAASANLVADAIPELEDSMPSFRPMQHVYMTALMDAQNQAAAAAANFELVRRDHVLHRLGVPTEDARRARASPLAGSDLFGSSTRDFVTFITDEAKEARAVGDKYLHGPTAYKPKVMQVPKGKAVSGATKTLDQPFRKSFPPKQAYSGPVPPPPPGAGRGRTRRSKGKSSGKAQAAASGKPGASGGAPA